MKVPVFVTGSAVILLVWLGATFFRPVPMETYGSTGPAVSVIKTVQEPTGEIDALTGAN